MNVKLLDVYNVDSKELTKNNKLGLKLCIPTKIV